MKLKPIEQQVVAVVGASSGIGRETALQFANDLFQKVVPDLTDTDLRLRHDDGRFYGQDYSQFLGLVRFPSGG